MAPSVADHHHHHHWGFSSSNPIVQAAHGGGVTRAEAARSRAELVKKECIEMDAEFTKYLDDKGRISVKQLRETPKLRHLYKIYDRVSVQLCRAERRRHAPVHTPPPSPPLKSLDDVNMDVEDASQSTADAFGDEFGCGSDQEVYSAATMLCRLSGNPYSL